MATEIALKTLIASLTALAATDAAAADQLIILDASVPSSKSIRADELLQAALLVASTAGTLRQSGIDLLINPPSSGSVIAFRHAGVPTVSISSALMQFGTAWPQNTNGHKAVVTPVTNVTTALANLTELSITVAAGQRYTGRIVLPINNALAADGFKLDLNGGTATMTLVEFGFSSAVGSTLGTRTATALNTAITITVLPDTNDLIIEIPVTMVVNAGGTVIPRQAKVADAAGATLTIRAGGYFHLDNTP